MMLEQLRATLQSALPGVPVDWGWSGQGQPAPRVVLTIISDLADYTQDGPSGYVQNRVQVDVYAATYAVAQGLYRTIDSVLSGLRAGLILGAFRVGRRDFPPEIGSETQARVSIDYMIHHTEE